MPLPIPWLEPVTTATLSASSISSRPFPDHECQPIFV
jgi:hypothetical protein